MGTVYCLVYLITLSVLKALCLSLTFNLSYYFGEKITVMKTS